VRERKPQRNIEKRRGRARDKNGALLTPDFLLALLRELLHVSQGLTEIAKAK